MVCLATAIQKGFLWLCSRTQQNEAKATKDLQNEDHSSSSNLAEDIVLLDENEEKENMLVSFNLLCVAVYRHGLQYHALNEGKSISMNYL